MPVFLVVVSIVLVTAARLRRRVGASATSLDEMNGPRWLSGWMARGFSCRVIAAWMLLLTGLATGGLPSAQPSRPLVYVVPIEGMIDLGLAPFLSRTIREAEEAGAAAVLLDINTFGGRVDAAVAMRDALLNARVRTIAFVNQRAISAGALIALARDDLIMTEGGTIGAATPVLGGGSGATSRRTKSRSPTCERSSARRRSAANRPAEFAEAMVDVDVEIPGVVAKGKLLTLTTSEALEHKVAELSGRHGGGGTRGGRLAGARRAAHVADLGRDPRPIPDAPGRQLPADDGRPARAPRGDPDPGFAVPGTIGLLSLGCVLLGALDRPARGLGGAAAGRSGVAPDRARVFVIPGLRRRGHRRDRRARRAGSA